MPFGCKHEAESDDLEPEADVVARGANRQSRFLRAGRRFERGADVRADDSVIVIAPLLAGADSLSKRETRPVSPCWRTQAPRVGPGVKR